MTQVTTTDSNDANPITTSATYLATCTNPVICNRPTSTTDAAGNTTNYAYNATHGGMTMHRFPSSGTGEPRSRITYSYVTKQARYLTGASTWSNSGNIYVPLRTSRCQTAETCSGSVNEARVEYAYAGSTTPNNLQPISVTTKLGNNTEVATSSFTYTDLGQVESVDGPLAGTADTSWNVYDDYGRMIGSVSADPDGAGGNDPLASRIIITDGLVTARESGTATSTDLDNDFTADQRQEIQYDDYGRPIIQRHVALTGTDQYGLRQVSYNDLGLVECTALRLNGPSTTTGLSTACTPMTAASPSPGTDRIGKRTYDNYGRVTEVRTGVGTTLEQVTQTFTYRTASTQNGQVRYLTDANNNRTEYEYDAFGRLYRVEYPHQTIDNYANQSDYDEVTFDSTGRVDSFRTRAGETFDFTYDNLGRLITVEVPDRAGLDATHERDVWYDYDLMGNMTHAYFDCLPGASCGGTQEGVSFTYNALGQVLTSSNNMDGVTRTLTYGYDVAGRRDTITHPDSVDFSYGFDVLGRMNLLEDDSGNDLFTMTFDSQGRLATRNGIGNAPDMTFGFDAAGRLDALDIIDPVDPSGTSHDVGWDFTYNPASQVTDDTRDNDVFAFGSHEDRDFEYTPDGLNQYDSILNNLTQFTTNYTYSANGNLTSDGEKTYTYDTENRLVEVVDDEGPIVMRYDPLGRLYEVEAFVEDDEEPGEYISNSLRRLYYDGADLVFEYDGNDTMLARYVHGVSAGDDPLVSYSGDSVALSNARFLYADRLGSIVLISDQSGSDRTVNSYDPFGVPNYDPNGVLADNNDGRFQYTGQAWVPEIGMFYYKARMYSPTLGRFMQTDPIGYADGMNMYAYVGNDPINGVDPTGLREAECWAGSIGGGTLLGWTDQIDDDLSEDDQRDAAQAWCDSLRNMPDSIFSLLDFVSPYELGLGGGYDIIPFGAPGSEGGRGGLSQDLCALGEGVESIGEAVTFIGLAGAVGGAILSGNPGGAVPGLGFAEFGGLISTTGQLLADVTQAESIADIGEAGARAFVSAVGGRAVATGLKGFRFGPYLDRAGQEGLNGGIGSGLGVAVESAIDWIDPEYGC